MAKEKLLCDNCGRWIEPEMCVVRDQSTTDNYSYFHMILVCPECHNTLEDGTDYMNLDDDDPDEDISNIA